MWLGALALRLTGTIHHMGSSESQQSMFVYGGLSLFPPFHHQWWKIVSSHNHNLYVVFTIKTWLILYQ